MATIREEAASAEIVATGKRWCSSCQSTKAIEGGIKTPRMWRCKGCVERRKQHMGAEKGVALSSR